MVDVACARSNGRISNFSCRNRVLRGRLTPLAGATLGVKIFKKKTTEPFLPKIDIVFEKDYMVDVSFLVSLNSCRGHPTYSSQMFRTQTTVIWNNHQVLLLGKGLQLEISNFWFFLLIVKPTKAQLDQWHQFRNKNQKWKKNENVTWLVRTLQIAAQPSEIVSNEEFTR